MEKNRISTVDNVVLNRRGFSITGNLLLSPYHLVFSFASKTSPTTSTPREIWICYPIIDRISKARGSSWINNNSSNGNGNNNNGEPRKPPQLELDEFDHYTASHIRLQCKDFTFYSFDFMNDMICCEVFLKMSNLISTPKTKNDIRSLYAFNYKHNILEQDLTINGWGIYDPIEEYKRQGLITDDEGFWRVSKINEDYKTCPSYPNILIVPKTISDNVLKHASKFRSKQRTPSVVYKHRLSANGNVIARCSQPLVGLSLQNRSIQDEKLIEEIFRCQELERLETLEEDSQLLEQPQRNLIVDLRPLTNAMAQHALGAGTESIENYRGRKPINKNNGIKDNSKNGNDLSLSTPEKLRQVEKIFCNIDNIHVMRDSLNKLMNVLNDLDKYPNVSSYDQNKISHPFLQSALTKTQWLHRLSIILQSVDRISKSIHLNNTNVVIHCSDGWDRTSQVSALSQLCLDPYYRTIKGFMVLVEKEWASFGFKFATRADHGGSIGAIVEIQQQQSNSQSPDVNNSTSSLVSETSEGEFTSSVVNSSGSSKMVTSFFQRAANHIKNTASAASNAVDSDNYDGIKSSTNTTYSGSNEKSPIFHQFLDCVYQILRQHPTEFEFNSRFLKRLFYHYYSCQYGSFLCDSERESKMFDLDKSTVSVWDYFYSRPAEFKNNSYTSSEDTDSEGVLFFNYTDVKWWYELYGRTDEEMNGLSNSLDRKFAQMKLNQHSATQKK